MLIMLLGTELFQMVCRTCFSSVSNFEIVFWEHYCPVKVN